MFQWQNDHFLWFSSHCWLLSQYNLKSSSSFPASRVEVKKSNTSYFFCQDWQWANYRWWDMWGAFWGKASAYTGKIKKAGTILSLLLSLRVLTMAITPRVATRWSRGRRQEDQRYNQPITHWSLPPIPW